MQTITRRKVETAERVREFIAAHPRTDAGFIALAAQLEAAVVRATQLMDQEEDGRIGDRMAADRRRELKRHITGDLLRPLARIGVAAGRTQPEHAGRFPAPEGDAPHAEFLATARRRLTDARAVQPLLAQHGLPDALLGDLEAAIAEFAATLEATNEERRKHVDAVAQFEVLFVEIGRILRVLDGHYRYALRDDRATLAVWRRIRRVVGAARDGTPDPAAGGEDVEADRPAA